MLRAPPSTPQYRGAASVGRVQQAPGGDNNFSEIDYSPVAVVCLTRWGLHQNEKKTLNLSHLCVFQMNQSDIYNLTY